ncbi:MAG TPA: hypothetical protein VKA63_05590 [Candidatus Krumholzibacteria bacterium]|nr:hypothetical protein [Candidatus Krumholzibacteria bacterium]
MRHLIFVILLSLVITSCGDDTTGPTTTPFSLEVQVHESDGTPVEGSTVAVWNFTAALQPWLPDSFSKRAAATAVSFSLPQSAICWMSLYDLDGQTVETVIDGDTLPAGEHMRVVGQNLELLAGVQVYRYELIAQDVESGEELFRDAKYMTIVELDHTRFQNGKTDANGRCIFENRLIVPSLYDLPEMTVTDETGSVVGSFALDDSLRIRIYDDQGQMMEIRRTARDGRNSSKVIWDPQSAATPTLDPNSSPRRRTAPELNPASMNGNSAVPQSFKLSQNYPNPFG